MKPVHGDDAWLYPEALDFSSNVNPLGPSEAVITALKEALEDIKRYPPAKDDAKQSIAEYNKVDAGIVLGNGSSEIIKNYCELVKGKVLILTPTFSEYEYFSRLYGARVELMRLPEEQCISLENLPRGYDHIFICHPNNPTSHYYTEAETLLDRGVKLFIDEAYIEFSQLKSFSPLVESYENLFVLRSLTKFFSLPGLRAGYALCSRKLAEKIENRQPPWNVNSLALKVIPVALNDVNFIKRSKRFFENEREFLQEELNKLFPVTKAKANFFLLNLPISAGKAKSLLLEKKILVRDCTSFGLDRSIRVCIRTREENQKLLRALGEINAETG